MLDYANDNISVYSVEYLVLVFALHLLRRSSEDESVDCYGNVKWFSFEAETSISRNQRSYLTLLTLKGHRKRAGL